MRFLGDILLAAGVRFSTSIRGFALLLDPGSTLLDTELGGRPLPKRLCRDDERCLREARRDRAAYLGINQAIALRDWTFS